MDFLFQFQVKAKDVFYKDPIEFKLDGMDVTLYLDEKDWISRGQKIHISVTAADRNEAYKTIWKKMADFNNRLIFLTGESILITHLEFIIFNQTGEKIRDIFFRDIKLPLKQELSFSRIDFDKHFFKAEICEIHKSAIRYFNQAILSDLPPEQFRSLYLSLEHMAGSELVEAKCDKQNCGGVLICSNCHNTKKYPRVTEALLQKFIDSTGHNQKFSAKNLTAKNLMKIRNKLSHAFSKLSNKKALNIIDINHNLSLLIRWYLEEKYGIRAPGGSVVKFGLEAPIEKQFKTQDPNNKFALDIPSVNELKDHSPKTRWII